MLLPIEVPAEDLSQATLLDLADFLEKMLAIFNNPAYTKPNVHSSSLITAVTAFQEEKKGDLNPNFGVTDVALDKVRRYRF